MYSNWFIFGIILICIQHTTVVYAMCTIIYAIIYFAGDKTKPFSIQYTSSGTNYHVTKMLFVCKWLLLVHS